MTFSPATWTAAAWGASHFNAVRDLLREVGPGPTQIVFDAVMPEDSATNWNAGAVDTGGTTPYRMSRSSNGTDGATITWQDLWLTAGTWAATVIYRTGTNYGNLVVAVDDVDLATFDGYASSSAWKISHGDPVAIDTPGLHDITLRVDGKNFLSSGYVGQFVTVILDLIAPAYPGRWLPPRTWTDGEIESAAVWEREIRENLNAAGRCPKWQVIDPWAGWASANTNWSTVTTNALDLPLELARSSSGAQNAQVDLLVGLPAGTFTLYFWNYRGSDRGIFTVSLDGVTQGTVDGYKSTHDGVLSSVTLTVTTTGLHTLRFKMATKTGASSSYVGHLGRIYLKATAITATWTTPKHWSPLSYLGTRLVTPALLNEQIRDNLNARGPASWTVDIDVHGAAVEHAYWNESDGGDPYSSSVPYQAQNTTEGGSEPRGYKRSVWVPLTAGTWEITLWARESGNKGKIDVYLDPAGTVTDVQEGRIRIAVPNFPTTAETTFDAYNGSGQDTLFVQGSLTVGHTGLWRVTLVIDSKNGSSTGYEGSIYHGWLRRTA